MNAKLFIAIVGLSTLCTWTSKYTSDIKKAEWLIGTWENNTSKGTIYETWKKNNDNELSGMSYIIKDKDTIVYENIQLVQEKDKLVYIPIVKNQNGGLPVRFTAKMVSENHMVFENLQHDFPQIISYTQTDTNALVAEISGSKNGRERKQTFPMKRMK